MPPIITKLNINKGIEALFNLRQYVKNPEQAPWQSLMDVFTCFGDIDDGPFEENLKRIYKALVVEVHPDKFQSEAHQESPFRDGVIFGMLNDARERILYIKKGYSGRNSGQFKGVEPPSASIHHEFAEREWPTSGYDRRHDLAEFEDLLVNAAKPSGEGKHLWFAVFKKMLNAQNPGTFRGMLDVLSKHDELGDHFQKYFQDPSREMIEMVARMIGKVEHNAQWAPFFLKLLPIPATTFCTVTSDYALNFLNLALKDCQGVTKVLLSQLNRMHFYMASPIAVHLLKYFESSGADELEAYIIDSMKDTKVKTEDQTRLFQLIRGQRQFSGCFLCQTEVFSSEFLAIHHAADAADKQQLATGKEKN